jgi:prophage tail gpP-like protein
MPDPAEFCEVVANGQRLRGWTHVEVAREFGAAATEFKLTAADADAAGLADAASRLPAGTEVQIVLAGTQVANGLIYVRQGAMNPRSRSLMVQGLSRTAELVIASHIAKGGQYKGYSFEQIANAVTAPFGIKFQWAAMPADAAKPFRDPQVFIGETAFSFLERLARQRGIKLHDDEHGNLIGDDPAQGGGQTATLEEGKNIWSIVTVTRDDTVFSRLDAIGQQKGDDNVFGKSASQVRATATDPAVQRYRPLMIVAEEPSNQADLQSRVNREIEERRWTAVQVQATVRGWLKPGGGLWNVGEYVDLKAPWTLPTSDGTARLFVQSVTFAQSPETPGTITTLGLALRPGAGGIGSTTAGSPNVFTATPTKAEPVA